MQLNLAKLTTNWEQCPISSHQTSCPLKQSHQIPKQKQPIALYRLNTSENRRTEHSTKMLPTLCLLGKQNRNRRGQELSTERKKSSDAEKQQSKVSSEKQQFLSPSQFNERTHSQGKQKNIYPSISRLHVAGCSSHHDLFAHAVSSKTITLTTCCLP